MTTEELLRRWAEHEFGRPVDRVEITECNEPDWSEWTPGMGDYMEVCCWRDGERILDRTYTYPDDYVALIHSITNFAGDLLDTEAGI